jgi:hypothetical protein
LHQARLVVRGHGVVAKLADGGKVCDLIEVVGGSVDLDVVVDNTTEKNNLANKYKGAKRKKKYNNKYKIEIKSNITPLPDYSSVIPYHTVPYQTSIPTVKQS